MPIPICGSKNCFIFLVEDLRASTPDDRDLYSTPGSRKQRSSSPKFMANHEIIKSLLTKGEKPKLLQLINEHGNSKDEKCSTKTQSIKLNELFNEKGTNPITYIPSSQMTPPTYSNKQRGMRIFHFMIAMK